MAHWFMEQGPGALPIERAALGAFDLSVLYVAGQWQWLVRRDGHDVAEGAARVARAARQHAEAVVLKLGEIKGSGETMTPGQLKEKGKHYFGKDWAREIAAIVGYHPSTVTKWPRKYTTIPERAAVAFRAWEARRKLETEHARQSS